MASAVFKGTSLVNMFVKDCWVNGIRNLIINSKGDEVEFFDIRSEWSDRKVLYLHRSYADFERLFQRLLECFPEDRRNLSKSLLIDGLIKIKEAKEIEVRLNEVERVLKNTINMPCKFSRYDEDENESVELDLIDDDTEAYVTNLSYYHLVPFETDILE